MKKPPAPLEGKRAGGVLRSAAGEGTPNRFLD